MPSKALRQQLMSSVRSVVVKVGTAVLTGADGQLDRTSIARITRQLAELHRRGIQVTLVTSGAVGAGMGRVGLEKRPRKTAMLQATAAVGQPLLMGLYERNLRRAGLHAGQVLVTRPDFEQRGRYLNISNTIAALHKLKAIPIINENDTIAVDELDRYADNDTIAALLTNLLKADLLVILSVVDGLLDSEGHRVDLITRVDDHALSLVRTDKSSLGSGGMGGKLAAARLVADAGECVVIANGRKQNVLLKLLDGERVGTIFAPAPRKLSARRRWMAGAVRPAGAVQIDAGAAEAVRSQGCSLLARGVTAVQGQFERNVIVRVLGPDGQTIAHGQIKYDSRELDAIKGRKSSEIAAILGQKTSDEVIHRDQMVLTVGNH